MYRVRQTLLCVRRSRHLPSVPKPLPCVSRRAVVTTPAALYERWAAHHNAGVQLLSRAASPADLTKAETSLLAALKEATAISPAYRAVTNNYLLLEESLSLFRSELGGDAVLMARTHHELAQVYQAQKRLEEAEREYESADRFFASAAAAAAEDPQEEKGRAAYQAEHIFALYRLGRVKMERGKHKEAAGHADRAMAHIELGELPEERAKEISQLFPDVASLWIHSLSRTLLFESESKTNATMRTVGVLEGLAQSIAKKEYAIKPSDVPELRRMLESLQKATKKGSA